MICVNEYLWLFYLLSWSTNSRLIIAAATKTIIIIPSIFQQLKTFSVVLAYASIWAACAVTFVNSSTILLLWDPIVLPQVRWWKRRNPRRSANIPVSAENPKQCWSSAMPSQTKHQDSSLPLMPERSLRRHTPENPRMRFSGCVTQVCNATALLSHYKPDEWKIMHQHNLPLLRPLKCPHPECSDLPLNLPVPNLLSYYHNKHWNGDDSKGVL